VKNSEKIEIPLDGVYPVLPLRDVVVFPHMVVPLFVGRDKSVKALDVVMEKNQRLLLLTQKNGEIDNPKTKDLYTTGTIAHVLQLLKLPDGTVKILVEGEHRATALRFSKENGFFQAYAEPIVDQPLRVSADEMEALVRTANSLFEQYGKLSGKIPSEIVSSVVKMTDYHQLCDSIASHLSLKVPEKQGLLEISRLEERFEKICQAMELEITLLQTEKRIRTRVKRQMEKSQREYYLNEQIKAIQKELGDSEETRDESSEIEIRIKRTKLSKEARNKAQGELKKFRTMNPLSSEATVVRSYLDWLLSIPWKRPSPIKKDLKEAERILHEDHYGLEKVKERILEFLAVQIRTGKVRGSILCLQGPPGVGKTSLGQSIARATGRQFVRMALGGVRDESEIRGHRRTYIGAMPGKIIQGMKKAGKTNPLFLLDEIDKMGADWRGDPASALLEVLDPEQNTTFSDHYIEVDYDLSDVMFVTTANSLNMPQPLLDRMEVIRLSGYTEDEKIQIAQRHLIPKLMERNGLSSQEWSIDYDALVYLIRHYTREAGVRRLEQELSKLQRKALKIFLMEDQKSITVTVDNIASFSGIEKHQYGIVESEDQIGITSGLAWTEAGGDLLVVEALMSPGKGKITLTGQLGEVMQESAQAAFSYIRSQCHIYGIEPSIFEKNDFHIHVPEGAIPKDGPSAGITICTSLVSMLTSIPVSRYVAMTGEVTLRGRVLPIGGLKEKLLAAHRGGITRVIIPDENQRDLKDIPEKIKDGLEIISVKSVSQVLSLALTEMPIPIEKFLPPKALQENSNQTYTSPC
jgi:ATP-dependent Lon protease